MWIALNYVTLTDWIQRNRHKLVCQIVVNCFKLCNFDRLNTTHLKQLNYLKLLWIALNYVTLTDWIQPSGKCEAFCIVVNCFKLCNFDRLNTTEMQQSARHELWIALNYVTLTDWIQLITDTYDGNPVVNCFKLCNFDRLNTTAATWATMQGCCELL